MRALVPMLLLVAAQAHAKPVAKLLDQAASFVAKGNWTKCVERVEEGLAAPGVTEAQQSDLRQTGYRCAVESSSVERASAWRTDDADPALQVRHGQLLIDAGKAEEAGAIVAGLPAEGELRQTIVDLKAQALAKAGDIDGALALVNDPGLGPAAAKAVAAVLLQHRRGAAALALYKDACAAGDVDCARQRDLATDLATAQAAEQPKGAPKISATAVHRVDYATSHGSFAGGNAFAVKYPGAEGPVVLAPLHLFGPRLGHPEQLASADLPEKIEVIEFPQDAAPAPWTVSRTLALVGAEVRPEVSSSDLAGFVAKPEPGVLADALELAVVDAKANDPVWVVVPLGFTADAGRYMHRGTVRQIADDGLVEVKFAEPVELKRLSGAPVLNAAGQVVGMTVSGGMAGPMYVAIAVPVSAIREHLAGVFPAK